MSGDSSYHSRHYSDKHYREDRYHRDDHYHRDDSRHYDYRRTRDRDSRDSYRNNNHQRRVPGLVSDPDSHLGDADKAIQRGQRETVSRVQSGRANYYKPTKEATASLDYRPPISTVTQPYYRSSYPTSDTKKSRRYFYNASFLSFLPGLAGLALIITAVVLPNWIVLVTFNTGQNSDQGQISYRGLFTICSVDFRSNQQVDGGCQSLEQFAGGGSSISNLEQATRGLVIITAILALVAVVVSIILGLRKFERRKGPFLIGGLYAFAGACGVAGMGCFSATLVSTNNTNGSTRASLPGTSFFLGWFGVGLLLVASVVAFLGKCAKKK